VAKLGNGTTISREKISVEAEIPSIDIAKEAIQEKEELFEEALEKRQLRVFRCIRSRRN